jgi:hypothetical protein
VGELFHLGPAIRVESGQTTMPNDVSLIKKFLSGKFLS